MESDSPVVLSVFVSQERQASAGARTEGQIHVAPVPTESPCVIGAQGMPVLDCHRTGGRHRASNDAVGAQLDLSGPFPCLVGLGAPLRRSLGPPVISVRSWIPLSRRGLRGWKKRWEVRGPHSPGLSPSLRTPLLGHVITRKERVLQERGHPGGLRSRSLQP